MNDKQQLAAMGEHMREMEECNPGFKVPDGWKLVPLEPTKEMSIAGCQVPLNKAARHNTVYRAMLAAAPEYKP